MTEKDINSEPTEQIREKDKDQQIITYRYDEDMFNNFSDQEAMIAYVTPFIKGKGSPFDKVEDGIKVLLAAKELDIPFFSALTRGFPVNNKIAFDSHIIRGLAQRGGIAMTTIEDYRPLYAHRYKDSTFLQDTIDENPEMYKVFTSSQMLSDYMNTTKGKEDFNKGIIPVLRGDTPYDYRTKIKFERKFRFKDGSFTHQIEYATFTYSEAKQAELTNKSNWQKYGRDCLYARTTTRGLRRIGGDIVHGIIIKDEFGFIGEDDDPNDYQDYEIVK